MALVMTVAAVGSLKGDLRRAATRKLAEPPDTIGLNVIGPSRGYFPDNQQH